VRVRSCSLIFSVVTRSLTLLLAPSDVDFETKERTPKDSARVVPRFFHENVARS
jgi:hypothetical protein